MYGWMSFEVWSWWGSSLPMSAQGKCYKSFVPAEFPPILEKKKLWFWRICVWGPCHCTRLGEGNSYTSCCSSSSSCYQGKVKQFPSFGLDWEFDKKHVLRTFLYIIDFLRGFSPTEDIRKNENVIKKPSFPSCLVQSRHFSFSETFHFLAKSNYGCLIFLF